MLKNLVVCGFALAALAVLTADASAFGGRKRSCGSSCGSSCGTVAYSTCSAPAPAPVYYAPPPPPAPVYQPCYQPTCYTTKSCCGGKTRSRGCGKRGCH